MISEAQARTIIDQQLMDVGWDPTNPQNVELEKSTDQYRFDYVLKNSKGHPLAVLEAKKPSKNNTLLTAETKTKKYAEDLKVPFVFLADSNEIYFWDFKKFPYPKKIKTFYSQSDLERKFSSDLVKKDIQDIEIDKKITDRYYQIECIEEISKKIKKGKEKFLVEMATGAGKTRVAISLAKRLFESNQISKVLFICDRNSLAIQAEKNFNKHLKDQTTYILNKKGFKDEKSITITTLQTLIRQYNNASSGYYDLIFIDECHRSIYGQYRKTLDFFDAIKVGLTATPCEYKNPDDSENEDLKFIRDTLKFFELEKPTYSYNLKQGIEDKYLVPYVIYKAKTVRTEEEGVTVNKNEIDWTSIENQKEKDEILKLFQNSDEAIVPHSWIERKITIPSRNQSMVDEFKTVIDNGFADSKGNFRKPALGKTIVFAVTKKHAITLAQMFDKKFRDKLDNPDVRFADYVVSQDGEDDISEAKNKIENFLEKEYPKILVSVGMLDTGFDCAEVTSLIFGRFTKSNILYKQMRGRGSRLAPHINKKNFWIFDFCYNTTFHDDEDEIGDGGVVIIKEPKKNNSPRGLVEIDVDDWIDPKSREIIDLEDNGKVRRPMEHELKADKIAMKYENFINNVQTDNYEKNRFMKILGEYLKANATDISKIDFSDFANPPFTDLSSSGEILFNGKENFKKILNDINENVL